MKIAVCCATKTSVAADTYMYQPRERETYPASPFIFFFDRSKKMKRREKDKNKGAVAEDNIPRG